MSEKLNIDGFSFYKSKGYWVGSIGPRSIKRLHVYIWEKNNGKVPKGFSIHHIDHNIDNNELCNLKLLTTREHHQYHMLLRDKQEMRDNLTIKARPLASKWHGSEAGIEWHKKHYKEQNGKLHVKKIITCQYCGNVCEVNFGGGKNGNKFCTNACKSAERRKENVDLIDKTCFGCGQTYSSSKYSRSKYCSRICALRRLNESKINKKNK